MWHKRRKKAAPRVSEDLTPHTKNGIISTDKKHSKAPAVKTASSLINSIISTKQVIPNGQQKRKRTRRRKRGLRKNPANHRLSRRHNRQLEQCQTRRRKRPRKAYCDSKIANTKRCGRPKGVCAVFFKSTRKEAATCLSLNR